MINSKRPAWYILETQRKVTQTSLQLKLILGDKLVKGQAKKCVKGHIRHHGLH